MAPRSGNVDVLAYDQGAENNGPGGTGADKFLASVRCYGAI